MDSKILSKVLHIIMNDLNFQIQREAIYVITNLLTTSTDINHWITLVEHDNGIVL